ncbi:uncharacterized protein [Fopius arisanus]|uniref:Uncharacterized protein n=1 Tax=Fopius arisanus TaxID=64838 RepID=A0A9R1U572_9HYME|nr:PREDICTED: uncharacterized protein LOC105269162 [Fopius arisanus]
MTFCYKSPKVQSCPMASDYKSHGLREDLEETVNEMEKRHGELASRRQFLTEKILNLEKTMPLLVAHKFWSCGQRDKVSFERIQQLVDELSPYPYPNSTEKLLKETNDKLQRLNEETKQLHDKIIEADVKIEESGMELESLLLVNNELAEKIKSSETKALEKERRAKGFPDLHEIDPEDIACLGRIRQLVQQEIRLKNCITALEDRETHMQAQLNQLLPDNKKLDKRPNKCPEKSKRGKKRDDKNVREPPVRTHSSSTRDDVCHCDSEGSLYQNDSTSDDDSDDEYWECCNCEGH